MVNKNFDYDITVIGSGPAGYVAAIRAAQNGTSVALIEKGPMGGVCTNVGCIPTKALIHNARLIQQFKGAEEFGIGNGDVKFDFTKIAEHRNDIVNKLSYGVESLLKGNKVEIIRGEASFVDVHHVEICNEKGKNILSSAKFIIATGSKPGLIPGIDFDSEYIINSATAVKLDRLPESMIIIGGGYIGCEFAAAFSAMGVKVTVVEMLDSLLPQMDNDCSREITRSLKKLGAKILTGVKLDALTKKERSVTAELSNSESINADKALISIGRKPYFDGLDIGNIGIKLDDSGAIYVNKHMQTCQENIYAVGDVTGGTMLAHVGSHEGLTAAAHACGNLTSAMDYRVVPACAFTLPEMGTVGLTEQEAKKKGLDFDVKKYSLKFLGKALVDDTAEGFVKMIANARTGELLGIHIVAADASSLMGEAALALQLEVTAAELADTIHAHPTMAECLLETAQALTGKPVNWMG